MTHSKKRIPLLNLLINSISVKSATQILSMKGEWTFPFLNFLIIHLCNSSANPLFEIFLLLSVPPEVFSIKKSIDR